MHPGQIDLDDSPQVCEQLSGIVNLIIDRMIRTQEARGTVLLLASFIPSGHPEKDDNPRKEEPV